MRQIGCRVSEELFAAIELARGDVPRERWMRRVFEEASAPRPALGATRELYALAAELRGTKGDALS